MAAVTDAELRDQAVAELEATTISYPTWLDRVENGYKGKPYDPAKTSWGRAFAALEQIGSSSPHTRTGLAFFRLGAPAKPGVHADDYDRVIVLSPLPGADVAKLVIYKNPTYCRANGEDWNGMDAEEVRANGWALKDSAGSEIQHTWGPSLFPDIGSASWRLKYAQNVLAWLQSYGAKATYLDDIVPTSRNASATPVKYPTAASFRAAMLGMVEFVADYLRDRGIYVAVNANAWDDTPAGQAGILDAQWFRDLGPFVDGIMDEWWVSTHMGGGDPSFRDVRHQGTANWWDHYATHQAKLGVINELGKDAICLHYSTDQSKMRYCLVAFLLDFTGDKGMFCWAPGGASSQTEPWNSDFDKALALGAPAGVKTRTGNTWKRTFQHGSVQLDSVAGMATII